MYVYICVYVYIYICVCVYIYIYAYACVYVNIFSHMYTNVYRNIDITCVYRIHSYVRGCFISGSIKGISEIFRCDLLLFFIHIFYTMVRRTQTNTLGRGAPAALRPPWQ